MEMIGKVKAISWKNPEKIGILLDDEKWYNGDKTIRDGAEQSKLNKGDKIKLTADDKRNITEWSITEKAPEQEENEREVVGLKDLLDAAHSKDLQGIRTEYVKIDYDKKMAHIKAYAQCPTGTFEGSACKSVDNMQGKQKDYWLETIESQAIARALRWLSNTGEVSDVEVGEKNEEKTEN